MCFQKLKENGVKPLIAEKDIRCYKYVIVKNNDKKKVYSYYQNNGWFFYIRGEVSDPVKLVRSSLNIPGCKEFFIYEGYHSLVHSGEAFSYANQTLRVRAALFIIPKGTKYFVNGMGDMVSEQIIYKHLIYRKPRGI